MKVFLLVLRLLVGGLFVFSGLVKLNDPVGTAIKMEEYFEVFATDTGLTAFFHFFASIALPIATFFCIAEVVLGVALLIGYRMRQTMWAMLGLIIFFTFLTWYSAYYNKVTDCGCFGDFIKLKPWTSFWKDISLLIPILFLFIKRKEIEPSIPEPLGSLAVLASTAVCTFAGIYAIDHLPFMDWRPYHVGADIPNNMKASAPLKYGYVMERNGETQEFDEYPTDTTWQFKSMEVKNPEALQKITDYRVWNDEGDYTDSTFRGNKMLVVVRSTEGLTQKDFAHASKMLKAIGQPAPGRAEVWAITSLDAPTMEAFRHEVQLSAPFYYCDGTVLKTIMRSKIGFWLLKDGVVKGKWSFNDVPDAATVRALLVN